MSAGEGEFDAPYRVAIRDTGQWVVAYLAPATGIEGWMEMARIEKVVLEFCPSAWDDWKTLCSRISMELLDLIEPGLSKRSRQEWREPQEKKG